MFLEISLDFLLGHGLRVQEMITVKERRMETVSVLGGFDVLRV